MFCPFVPNVLFDLVKVTKILDEIIFIKLRGHTVSFVLTLRH